MDNINILDLLNDEEDFKSDEELDAYADSLLDAIQNGATLKDVYAVPNDTMQDLYKLAYDFYHHGKLDDAESLFRFLCIYDFYNPDYYMGLAAVYQLQKQYQKAANIYAVAFSLAEHDYRPAFFTGQCQLLMQKANKAKQCFELVLEHSADEALKIRARAYLDTLNT